MAGISRVHQPFQYHAMPWLVGRKRRAFDAEKLLPSTWQICVFYGDAGRQSAGVIAALESGVGAFSGTRSGDIERTIPGFDLLVRWVHVVPRFYANGSVFCARPPHRL